MTNATADAAADPAAQIAQLAAAVDAFYIIMCGALVFFMQAGFGMLEAGCVTKKNVLNILFKNIMDASLAAIVFWLVGYGFAYGTDQDGPFIGTGNFALSEEDGTNFHSWFFQWAFTATAATIVAGSVAERCTPEAYFIYSILLSGFIYPVVVHWIWDTEGWMSILSETPMFGYASHDDADGAVGMTNVIDFAGCGVVHMVGGWAGLVGTIITGPRLTRFKDGVEGPEPHNIVLVALGTLILWFGWYGFNCGSVLGITSDNYSALAGRVAINTTIAPAAAALCATAFSKLYHGKYDVMFVCNGALAGLVSITAVAPYCQPWGAFVAGIIGAIIYKLASEMLIKLKIDDPLDAFPVHGACGMWGLLCPAIFNSDKQVAIVTGYTNTCYSTGLQIGVQLVAIIVVAAWVVATSILLFLAIKYTIGLRVDEEVEQEGLDQSEHGGSAYVKSEMVPLNTADTEEDAEVPKAETEAEKPKVEADANV